MTEEDAKTKWCPFARYVIDSGTVFPTGNRFEGEDGASATAREAARGCLCIGSACMAWRWGESGLGEIVQRRAAIGERPDGWSYLPGTGPSELGEWVRRGEAADHGFCGLAGQPS